MVLAFVTQAQTEWEELDGEGKSPVKKASYRAASLVQCLDPDLYQCDQTRAGKEIWVEETIFVDLTINNYLARVALSIIY